METRTFVLGAIAALLTLLVAGCGGDVPQQVEKITIGVTPVLDSSPFWIGESRGYFKEVGLDVRIKEFQSGRTALRAMLYDGGIDLVTAAQTPVVSNSFSRADYAIVANMAYSDTTLKMLARRDRGIGTASDLKGKTVGVTSNSAGHFFLGLFLVHHRLQMADIKVIDLEPAPLSHALIEGQVDAIATWEPFAYKTRRALGDTALLLPSGGFYRQDFYFIAPKTFIKNSPEALKRFLRAIEKGEQFILNSRKEALDIVGQRLKMDSEMLDVIRNDFQFKLALDQFILIALEDEARWAMRNKLTDAARVPNYLDYIYTGALKAVKPEAVTIAGR